MGFCFGLDFCDFDLIAAAKNELQYGGCVTSSGNKIIYIALQYKGDYVDGTEKTIDLSIFQSNDKDWNKNDIDSRATTKKSKEEIYKTQLVPVFADLYESNKNAFQQFGINDFDFLNGFELLKLELSQR